MQLIDISQGLSPATAVWPGDQPFEWTWTARVKEGASVNLGAIALSTHTGSHVDAPLHVRADGASTDVFDLDPFVGPAHVVDVTGADMVQPSHVADLSADRLLFKTSAREQSEGDWPDAITPIAPETVSVLSEQGVELIGTDAPSVDPLDCTDLPAHHALVEAGILNLEGLMLEKVSPGPYTLLALPLKLENADAAPIRAVLAEGSLDL
jgi:arylformamidase